MTETTNLGLPIYGDNDVPDWMNTNDGFEALDSLVNSCADVQLDFAHPLHKFTTGNLTYTTTKECYLYGSINASQNTYTTLSIDGNVFASVTGSQSNYYEQGFEIGPIRLNSGTVVTLSAQGWNPNLYILEGTIVSGNTYVFNEAQVTLDYANPLHTFSANNLSYTATQDCYIYGPLANTRTLKINGTTVQVTGQDKVQPIYLKLSKGDTAVINVADENIKVYSYTVTGSVGNLGGYPDLDWSTPLHTFNSVGSYTATTDCYLTGFVPNTGIMLTLTINGTQVITNNYGSGGVIAPIKIHSGDVVSTNVLSSALHILKER